MKRTDCDMCLLPSTNPEAVVAQNERAFAFDDLYTLNRPHLIIVPSHHLERVSQLPPDTFLAMHALAKVLKTNKDIGDFNWVIDDGAAAGQLYAHVSANLIPRQEGDFGDRSPRAGVRLIFPDGDYDPSKPPPRPL